MKILTIIILHLCALIFALLSCASKASSSNGEADNLQELVRSKWYYNKKKENDHINGVTQSSWEEEDVSKEPYFVLPQEGMRENDRISALPGQPYNNGVDFDQYSGYVTVDPIAGRALFYYFVESPYNSSSKPLVLWLNGGPGCSSLGYGAMEELGPFRINSDGKTLFRNEYAWNNVANVLFVESPAGVGFSYSNTSSDYEELGDKMTANDAYIFLVNWFERFPEYKSRDFFIAGESYAGHYAPQFAYTILIRNKLRNRTTINLKGIAIGNALIDDATHSKGQFDYLWTHGLYSDETHAAIDNYCDFASQNFSLQCFNAMNKAVSEMGAIDYLNIYAPLCHDTSLKNASIHGSVYEFDPCSNYSVKAYLNNPEVQLALQAKPTNWTHCRKYPSWRDRPNTILPTIKYLIASGIRVWIYSGDIDGLVPVTSSRYSINSLNLSIIVPWYSWYSGYEVGGYVVQYEGITFVTVRGAGHLVPSWQPARALTLFTSFIKEVLPPSSPAY